MIKRLKKITLCLAALLTVGGGLSATKALAATQTFTQVNQITNECYKGYNNGSKGPIIISNATFRENGQTKPVYFITLSGTEFVPNQSTGLCTDLKAGFEQNSPYLLKLAEIINRDIPKNSNLIFAGHSLGGMIAQQASGHASIKNNYNILNVVTLGSPLINPFGREGTIRRLGDKSDVVPYLSAMGTILEPWQIAGLNTEDGGYGWDKAGAHIESYKRADLWGKYDIVGNKGGNATITFDPNQARYYQAPTK